MSVDDREDAPGPESRGEPIERLYAREAPRLTRFFRRSLGSAHDVPDLVQESFVRLIGAAGHRRAERSGAYLQRIARNLLFDRTRHAKARRSGFHVSFDETLGLSTEPEQGHALEADDVIRLYRAALAGLPERTRTIFLLHRVDGLGYKLIGERLGISIPTVQYHVAKALVQIDKALERE